MAGVSLSSLHPKILHFDGLNLPRRAFRFRVWAKTVLSILLENEMLLFQYLGIMPICKMASRIQIDLSGVQLA